MPKYFGENNPEIPDSVLINILSYLDNRMLAFTLPQVSKSWQLITKEKKIHHNILTAILKRINFFPLGNIEDKIEVISSGYTNTNYKIFKDGEYYILRIPIMKNHLLIERQYEKHNTIIAHRLGLGARLMFYEKSTGIMVTKYIDNQYCLTKEHLADKGTLTMISRVLRLLHNAPEKFQGDWLIFNKIRKLYDFLVENCSCYNKEMLKGLMNAADRVKCAFDKLNIQLCPCHNDLSSNNFLYIGNGIRIIDWEFSGNNDPMWDLSFLSTVSQL